MKKIFTKKDNGELSMPLNLLLILFFILMLFYIVIDYQRLQYLSNQVTDVLTDALLGAGTLTEEDQYLYGREDKIKLSSPRENYHTFQDILKTELGLSSDYTYTRNSMIKGKVKIEDFIIYNVDGSDIIQNTFFDLENYTTTNYPNGYGVVSAPNGKIVESTSIYARISFTVNFIDKDLEVTKEHMVDVKKY